MSNTENRWRLFLCPSDFSFGPLRMYFRPNPTPEESLSERFTHSLVTKERHPNSSILLHHPGMGGAHTHAIVILVQKLNGSRVIMGKDIH